MTKLDCFVTTRNCYYYNNVTLYTSLITDIKFFCCKNLIKMSDKNFLQTNPTKMSAHLDGHFMNIFSKRITWLFVSLHVQWRLLKHPGLKSPVLHISVFQDRPDREEGGKICL